VEKVFHDLKQLLLRTRILLRAALCGCKCYFFVVQQRSNQENELGRSLRALPFVPLCKAKKEKDIEISSVSLTASPTRAAGADSKKSCGFLKGIRPLSSLSLPFFCGTIKKVRLCF
jgi:hypothetical protein